ncbi:DUF4352 domain-containing protein [Streptomyces sp. NPDC001985]|uniref:DUF4352 domain-containing protein n=1 Tax=Streptomyces sp. NPDC001985 TaxID=3154406 RepID=UPI00332109A4
MASTLLLSALALTTTTSCQNPFDSPPHPPTDHKPRPAIPTPAPAWFGDSVDLTGRGFGEHLRVSVLGQVDPAVATRAAEGPGSGKRWFGADVSLLNIGGRPYDTTGARAWAVDETGKRYSPVTTGRLTTGAPLTWNTLAVGEQKQGWLVFEVPERSRIVRLHTALGNHTSVWQLRFPPSR